MAISKQLANIQTKLNKKYGKEFISTADNVERIVEWQKTGSIILDASIGGGFPKGRIIEVYGPESAGKTTTCLLAIAQFQRDELAREEQEEGYKRRYALFADAEHTFEPVIADEYGINLEELIVVDAVTAEQIMDITRAYVESGEIGIAVVDSVAALNPAQIEGASFEQKSMGVQARFMSDVCRSMAGIIADTECVFIFINQIREKIGAYGNPETTPGGRSLKFYASVRLAIRPGEPLKEKDERVGHQLKFNVVKNKVAKPYKQSVTTLVYGVGVDNNYELVEIGLLLDYFTRAGAWYRYITEDGECLLDEEGKELKFQGKDGIVKYVSENEYFFNILFNRINGIDSSEFIEDMSQEDIDKLKRVEKEENKEIYEEFE